jgi:hypothetical protein
MPSFMCVCDTLIALHAIPEPNAFYAVPDTAREVIKEEIDDLLEGTGRPVRERSHRMRDLLGPLNPAVKEAIVCPTCGRIHFFFPNGDLAMTYAREDGIDTPAGWLLGPTS